MWLGTGLRLHFFQSSRLPLPPPSQAESQALRKEAGIITEESMKTEATCYLCIDGMVNEAVLQNDEEYNEVTVLKVVACELMEHWLG